MSHDHEKKPQTHHDSHTKKAPHHDHHDHGKLHDAAKNKDISGTVIDAQKGETPTGAPMTKIIVNVGTDQGINDNMTAYVTGSDGLQYEVAIDHVKETATYAWVDTTPYNISQGPMIVVFKSQ
jgi:hypothetical protein